MEELEKEGTKTEIAVEDTGTSPENPEIKEETVDNLATTPVPTPEEKEEASIPTEPAPVSESNEIEPAEKTFTQSQVNDLVGKTRTDTRNKTFEYIYGRYGVKDETGLDDLVGNAQRYDSLKEEYDGERANWDNERAARESDIIELKEKVALMESGIDRERYDDAKFILRGKGLEINAENIANELNSHPEWKKVEKVYKPEDETPPSKISVLGNEKENGPEHAENEEDYVMDKIFKVR